ncbi:MAG TPA: hypothetical protein VG826_00430 [Pirellulales bacterium]|nr:hypothetical protein [Pirellulales bacterium]
MTFVSQNRSVCARPPNGQSNRRGAVLILALVCLALISVIGGALLRWALMEHALLRSREQASQARWLAEAGIERAAAKLAAAQREGEPDYTGETWLIPAADLPGGQPGRIRLQVAAIEPGRRSIEVEVEYPLESAAPVRVHKQVVYQERRP